ncbi:hypothetical protein TRFO_12955 [Tritrichomonas foetus]|uniref:Protein kinase domain-containing protein n=1 Tax=Tritrichomonas foetus TaxID=1144522 RepID=A0A1J4KZM4_9EUKA|nr:hypothetical protein TRFO_12955 [Tritrichomonas foetus]|eukprot:OHT16703.1 hypothetical protein TRFO_12955 [Tritrichomonas foetus]
MLVGRFPFEDGGDYDGLSGLQALVARIEKEEPQFPHFLSDEAKHIIRRMLTKDPQKRATWDELFSHDWVQEQLLHVKSHAITARILSKNSTPTNKLLPPKSSPNSPQHFTRNNDSTPPPNGARIEFAPSVYLEVKKFNSTHLTPKSPEEIKPNDNETIKEIANENNNYKDQNDCRNYLDDKNNSIESSDSTNPPTIPSIPKSSRSPKHSPEGVKTDSKDNYNMNDNEDDNFSNGRKLANAIRNKICAKRRKSEFTVLRNFADEVRRNRLLSDEKSDNETSSSIIDKLCATGKFRRKNASNSGTEEKDNQIEPHFATTEINGESRK